MTGRSPRHQDTRMAITQTAAIAAHRFGLGEADLAALPADPVAWLHGQLGAAPPQAGNQLPDLATAWQVQTAARRQADKPAPAGAAMPPAASPEMAGAPVGAADALRQQVQADQRARLLTAVRASQPYNERLALFWANHFSVSLLKGPVQGLVGAFEREAIRPNIGGRFADLLLAATSHPAMLRYLDNPFSAGPQSPVAQRRGAGQRLGGGLNENLARELLELHTLGVAGGGGAYGPWGGYTQADISALAAVLTGWRGPQPNRPEGGFDERWHQPGAKTVLGRRYAEGPQALAAVLTDLARHPHTARHIATKLARHVVADEPPPALVDRLARQFLASDGDLPTLHRALVDAPEAWHGDAAKLRTPEEFVIASARLLRPPERWLLRQPDAGMGALGQRPQAAPSPAGWPDRAADWLGPEAVWRRVEWAARLAERSAPQADARALAQASLGPLLSADSRQQIERAADGAQALTLLLMAPEFQRR
jgi:uncharacterized protein (DUF1800 family)